MKKSKLKILIDADVVSHFLTGGHIYILPKIFPFPLCILDIVYKELQNYRAKRIEVENLLTHKIITLIPFPQENREVRKEYLFLKNKQFRGAGESACMAVARFSKDIIGSSNLKDIKEYCKLHEISYLTTLDFIYYAVENNCLSSSDADEFIRKLHSAGHRIPKKVQQYSDIIPQSNPKK